jgi:hypothetical protein
MGGGGGCVLGSNASWANMVVKALKRAYIIHQSHSELSYPNTRGRG